MRSKAESSSCHEELQRATSQYYDRIPVGLTIKQQYALNTELPEMSFYSHLAEYTGS